VRRPRKQRTVQRDCIWCGQSFPGMPHSTHCSRTCSQKTFRARSMLAGTHGWVGKDWKRISAKG
jgi:hypothetical protein